MKIPKKKQIFNQKTFRILHLYLAYRHTKMCVLIRHIICECLMKTQHLKQERSLIYGENLHKNQIKSRGVP